MRGHGHVLLLTPPGTSSDNSTFAPFSIDFRVFKRSHYLASQPINDCIVPLEQGSRGPLPIATVSRTTGRIQNDYMSCVSLLRSKIVLSCWLVRISHAPVASTSDLLIICSLDQFRPARSGVANAPCSCDLWRSFNMSPPLSNAPWALLNMTP